MEFNSYFKTVATKEDWELENKYKIIPIGKHRARL